jgi:hypothetical protein
MVSLLPSSAVVHGFKPWSGQTKDYIIAVCCIKTLRADWLAMVLCFMVFNTCDLFFCPYQLYILFQRQSRGRRGS